MYVHRSLANYILARGSDGQLYMVNPQPGGWHTRRPYHGHTIGLEPFGPAASRVMRRLVGGDDPDAAVSIILPEESNLVGTAAAAAALGLAPRTIQQHANRLGVGTRLGRDLYFAPDDIAAIRARIGKRGRPATT